MKDLAAFATDEFPLHPSGLRAMVECPWRVAMNFLYPGDGEAGPAADTGSALHAAAEAMHNGLDRAACIESMRLRIKEYPQADLADAARMFLAYSQDPRNCNAKVVLCERTFRFTIAPAETDATGAPIVVEGTVDQVREDDSGNLFVYDIKSSKKDPVQQTHDATFQIAAYCIGASVLLGKYVHPGALICTRQYEKAAVPAYAKVFWHFAWTFNDIEQILSSVRYTVANIRAGRLYHVPNVNCQWCRARTPDLCLPKLQEELRIRVESDR